MYILSIQDIKYMRSTSFREYDYESRYITKQENNNNNVIITRIPWRDTFFYRDIKKEK